MSHERFDNEDELRRAVIRDLDAGPIPPQVQVKLDGVYASLGSIPQDRPTPSGAGAPQRRQPVKRRSAEPAHGKRKGVRVARRGAMVAVAAVLVVPVERCRLRRIAPGADAAGRCRIFRGR